MIDLVNHAKTELTLAGLFDENSGYGGMLGKAVLELITVFSNQGHSGMSANKVSNLFNKLSRFKPLVPLTLNDDEWVEVSTGTFQNKRNSAVFKDGKNAKAYFIDAYYKKTQNNTTWSGRLELPDGKYLGRCYIKDTSKMPTVEIDVIEEEIAPDNWVMTIKNVSQLDELKKYYDFDILPKEEK